ncbi:DUF4136 domain-containing protein [Lacinutrix sp. MEBiC02595]
MKSIKILLLSFLVTACAPIYFTTDFEKGTDFSKYKTYNYYSDIETGLSELDAKRLFYVLDNQLQLQGLTVSETPDFFINIQSEEYQTTPRRTVGVGVGGAGRNVGGGVGIGIPIGQAKTTRQIIFEFVDENGIGLFWQATSESTYNPNANPEKREASLQALVEKVFKKYPPQQK